VDLGPFFKIHKKEQGGYTRLGFAGLILLFGIYVTYTWHEFTLTMIDNWFGIFMTKQFLGFLSPLVITDVLLMAATILGIIRYVGSHEKASEYFIETESEMRKVSWPTKDEVKGSSAVVIVVMFALALIIFFLDISLMQVAKLLFYR
jgi:preprotein translocase subunit SecE